MTKGHRQLLRESAFDLLDDEDAESKLAVMHGLNLSNRHDRKQIQEAIKRVTNAIGRLNNGKISGSPVHLRHVPGNVHHRMDGGGGAR